MDKPNDRMTRATTPTLDSGEGAGRAYTHDIAEHAAWERQARLDAQDQARPKHEIGLTEEIDPTRLEGRGEKALVATEPLQEPETTRTPEFNPRDLIQLKRCGKVTLWMREFEMNGSKQKAA